MKKLTLILFAFVACLHLNSASNSNASALDEAELNAMLEELDCYDGQAETSFASDPKWFFGSTPTIDSYANIGSDNEAIMLKEKLCTATPATPPKLIESQQASVLAENYLAFIESLVGETTKKDVSIITHEAQNAISCALNELQRYPSSLRHPLSFFICHKKESQTAEAPTSFYTLLRLFNYHSELHVINKKTTFGHKDKDQRKKIVFVEKYTNTLNALEELKKELFTLIAIAKALKPFVSASIIIEEHAKEQFLKKYFLILSLYHEASRKLFIKKIILSCLYSTRI